MNIFRESAIHILTATLLVVTIFFSTNYAFAHIGSGPPFLKIDEEYPKSNPLIIAYPDSRLGIPQDIMSKNLQTGKPSNFSVEVDKLDILPKHQQEAIFRWTWGDQTPSSMGVSQSHTYTKNGSYLVTLEMAIPNEQNFVIIDTVLVHSLPSLDYVLPKAHIKVSPPSLGIGKPITFSYDLKKDKNASIKEIKWRLDNNEYSSEAMPSYTYTSHNSRNIIILKVTDSNGYIGFSGITLESTNGLMQVKNIDNQTVNASGSNFSFYATLALFLSLCTTVYFISYRIQLRNKN